MSKSFFSLSLSVSLSDLTKIGGTLQKEKKKKRGGGTIRTDYRNNVLAFYVDIQPQHPSSKSSSIWDFLTFFFSETAGEQLHS